MLRIIIAIVAVLSFAHPLQAEMKLSSPAFKDQQPLPQKFTCKGANVSPPLTFEGIPVDTKSLALIVDDQDAPSGTFVHWIIWNVDPDLTHIAERSGLGFRGRNDFGALGYRGPCPPPGKAHRYIFHLYALDQELSLPDGITRQKLDEQMKGHILESAELTAFYGNEN
ncbi:MAG: YbhB/YbcL family Raf kinase inhibitor-like protein [Chlamydiales bacterium]|nr:YbhB/YbcL family Raf kinase inhibitor-like protein [Chlamydiales bacterium]